MNEELISKLSFEDRLEYNLSIMMINQKNIVNTIIYYAIVICFGISCYLEYFFSSILFILFLIYLCIRDRKKIKNYHKLLFNKYFQVKPKDKKKK